MGADMAGAGGARDGRAAAHLHEPDLLVDVDGGHGLVRAERLCGPMDSAVAGRWSAERSRGLLGRQWVVVLAALELRDRPGDQRSGRPRSLPRFVATCVARHPLTRTAMEQVRI